MHQCACSSCNYWCGAGYENQYSEYSSVIPDLLESQNDKKERYIWGFVRFIGEERRKKKGVIEINGFFYIIIYIILYFIIIFYNTFI